MMDIDKAYALYSASNFKVKFFFKNDAAKKHNSKKLFYEREAT